MSSKSKIGMKEKELQVNLSFNCDNRITNTKYILYTNQGIPVSSVQNQNKIL